MTENNMNFYFRHFILSILLLVLLTNCKKNSVPFSADAVHPSQGKVNAYVLSGGIPVLNAIINAIDPSGNNFSAITDSTGNAIFDPMPFSNGTWRLTIPNQDHRCIEQSDNFIVSPSATTSQSITFQYGVVVYFTPSNFQTKGLGGPIVVEQFDDTLSTQNDCGTPWNISFDFAFPTVANWTLYYPGGNSGTQNSGSSCCTYNNATSGTKFTISYQPNSNAPTFQVNVVSTVYGESRGYQGPVGGPGFTF